MKIWNRILGAAAVAALALGSTGCVSRTIVAFDDHPKHSLTTLEIFESRSYFFWGEHEHKFFSCTDTGDKLVCKRACGGNLDVRCPAEMASYNGRASNVR